MQLLLVPNAAEGLFGEDGLGVAKDHEIGAVLRDGAAIRIDLNMSGVEVIIEAGLEEVDVLGAGIGENQKAGVLGRGALYLQRGSVGGIVEHGSALRHG